MQKILYVFLALCLLQTAYSACADGTFTNPDAPANGKAACVQCFPGCTTCNSDSACITYIDKLKGIDRSDPASPTTLCSSGGGNVVGFLGTWGYNSKVDACDRCFDGCANCAFDYDYCTSCKEGWDFDRNGMACTRATLGLTAVVFALSAITLIFAVLTCVCACKL
jgi:hypothetical protein